MGEVKRITDESRDGEDGEAGEVEVEEGVEEGGVLQPCNEEVEPSEGSGRNERECEGVACGERFHWLSGFVLVFVKRVGPLWRLRCGRGTTERRMGASVDGEQGGNDEMKVGW